MAFKFNKIGKNADDKILFNDYCKAIYCRGYKIEDFMDAYRISKIPIIEIVATID